MPIEQSPIKIVIEDESIMQPEQARPGLGTTLATTGKQISGRAKSAWQSDQRKQAQAAAKNGLRRGARAIRLGSGRSLHWLSRQLAKVADRLKGGA